MLLDIHTHRLPSDTASCILSGCMRTSPYPSEARYISAGIHPWYLTAEDYPTQREWLAMMLDDPRTVALGEAGLDKHCNTPYGLQLQAFRYAIGLSESHHLPLIIHCVKCFNELIALKKEIMPHTPWIIHGFRGKRQLAESLSANGFYLSFGERYQPEALVATPADRLLLETDESETPIEELARQAARLRNLPYEEFIENITKNINYLFFNR
ncbi:TatD family hydrolase [uncultured Bacteroides sp.]|uniref:TatD family hydrolase n=1 Tax=uncultured Bacteroides sp. TaxID=162156 RepID=UPI00262C9776|nr:TatD family hydrolase [uncultured Bacteroides sp.]